MLLRANSKLNDESPNLHAITKGTTVDSGVAHGELLSELVELSLDYRHDTAEGLAAVRHKIAAAMSPEALVDAVAVIGNFQRMVRIADGAGIPLDAPMVLISADLRAELGYNSLNSAKNTPETGRVMGWLGRLLRPLMLKRLASGRV